MISLPTDLSYGQVFIPNSIDNLLYLGSPISPQWRKDVVFDKTKKLVKDNQYTGLFKFSKKKERVVRFIPTTAISGAPPTGDQTPEGNHVQTFVIIETNLITPVIAPDALEICTYLNTHFKDI